MFIVGLAAGLPHVADGQWLLSMDFNARRGRGRLSTSPYRRDAMVFPSEGEAMAYWRRRSDVNPIRPDGQPNRPLTAFTVEILGLDREPISG